MSDSPQMIEASAVGGKATVVVRGGGVSAANPQGHSNGTKIISDALQRAIGPALKRAAKLLGIIRASEVKEKELTARLADLDREKAAAPNVLFGAALTARLAELDEEVRAVRSLRLTAETERERSVEELQTIRDTVLNDAPTVVKRTVRDRIKAAEAERDKAAEMLAAAVAQHVVAVLKFDAELDVLDGTKPKRAVKRALETALPEIFGPGGLAGIPDLEAAQEREREREERRERYAVEEPFDMAQVKGYGAENRERTPEYKDAPLTRDDIEREFNRED